MKTTVALVLAAIWSVGLIVAAVVVPVYQSTSVSSSVSSSTTGGTALEHPQLEHQVVTESSATLVQENGLRVLALVGIPLLAVAVVSRSLWRRRVNARRGAGPVAWTVVGLLGAFTLVSMLSIGIFVLPVTGSLVFACAMASMVPGASRAPRADRVRPVGP